MSVPQGFIVERHTPILPCGRTTFGLYNHRIYKANDFVIGFLTPQSGIPTIMQHLRKSVDVALIGTNRPFTSH